MNSAAVGVLLVASILTPSAFLVLDSSVQNQVNELFEQFNNIMNETTTFLDHAWDIAQNFQDPNYDYDPSELGNYTVPTMPSNTTMQTQLAVNSSYFRIIRIVD